MSLIQEVATDLGRLREDLVRNNLSPTQDSLVRAMLAEEERLRTLIQSSTMGHFKQVDEAHFGLRLSYMAQESMGGTVPDDAIDKALARRGTPGYYWGSEGEAKVH